MIVVQHFLGDSFTAFESWNIRHSCRTVAFSRSAYGETRGVGGVWEGESWSGFQCGPTVWSYGLVLRSGP